jgi:hypothetical protein
MLLKKSGEPTIKKRAKTVGKDVKNDDNNGHRIKVSGY